MYNLEDPSGFMGEDDSADRFYRYIIKRLPREASCLDLACGRGRLIKALVASGRRAEGVDGDAKSIAFCQEQGLSAHRDDVFAFMRARTSTYDVVIATHFVEHLEPAMVDQLMADAATALRPGGLLLLVTPNISDWSIAGRIFWLDPTHVRPYPTLLLAAMGRQRGFEPIWATSTGKVRLGRKQTLLRPVRTLQFGREYGRCNAVILLRRSDEST